MRTKKAPRPSRARGIDGSEIGNLCSDSYRPASTLSHPWWGVQPCICRGLGHCLHCHRWHQVLERFAQRGIVVAAEVLT